MTHESRPGRPRTAVDEVADRYVEQSCELDPLLATELGIAGYDDRMPDLSPEGTQELVALDRRTLADLERLEPQDDVDRVTLAAMRERLGLSLEMDAAGLVPYAELNVIASPVQVVREVFDQMSTETADDWATVAKRMSAVGEALDGYVESLRHSASTGRVPARRQVAACLDQIGKIVDPATGFFGELAAGARPAGAEPDGALAADLQRSAAQAAEGYERLGAYLRGELLPVAREEDAVGPEEYALWSRSWVGAEVDLAETYAWGLEELARIEAEMAEVVGRITPGGTLQDTVAALEADPGRRIVGKDVFREWMQAKSDEAVEALAGTHFDIPEPVRRLECRIAPTSTGGIYYSGPSEDFSRPGRMWWSVPEGVDVFDTWRQTTTVYHEGVPGHHLQIGQTMYRSELLNRWRRAMCWTSGHGEGWALYAERLMADLGWLDDPGDRLGMLDGSALRAARVVVDIGTHCRLEAPDEVGGGTWDADKMWRFLRAHTLEEERFLRFEHLRYLGWPGQAPSYKIGERLWMRIREHARRQQGDAFDLKAFHRKALDLGSLPLDVLSEALTGTTAG